MVVLNVQLSKAKLVNVLCILDIFLTIVQGQADD